MSIVIYTSFQFGLCIGVGQNTLWLDLPFVTIIFNRKFKESINKTIEFKNTKDEQSNND